MNITIDTTSRQPTVGLPDGVHEKIIFWQGDSLIINGLLSSAPSVPLDLTSATITWVLMDINANVIDTLTVGSGITINSPTTAGSLAIVIPTFPTPGPYWDQLTVTILGVVETYWVGEILFRATFTIDGLEGVAT